MSFASQVMSNATSRQERYEEDDNDRSFSDELPFHGGMPQPRSVDASIMDTRWQAQQFIHEMWKSLADRTVVTKEDGSTVLVRETPTLKPPMNDKGAKDIIGVVTSHVNPVISLSNISDQEAKLLTAETLRQVSRVLEMKREDYEIEDDSMQRLIMVRLNSLIFCQLHRPVGGFEAMQSHTQTVEQKQDLVQENKTRTGLFSLGRR